MMADSPYGPKLPRCSVCHWRAGTHGDLRHPHVRYCGECKSADHTLLVTDGPVSPPQGKREYSDDEEG